MKTSAIFGALLLFSATGAAAAPLPDAVAAMLDAAGGDAAQLKTISDIAKKTNPQSVAEIDARVDAINKAQAAGREEKLANQGAFEGWSGAGEAGGFISSGNTNTKGVALGLNVSKETRKWKHSLRGFVDYQQQDGVTSRERYFAGYEGNYNITPDFYALLTLSWERDPFSGFDRRFAQSLGLGYKIVNTDRLKLSVEGGPALRQTRFTDGFNDSAFAARGAVNLDWQISGQLQFTQSGLLFYDSFNTSTQAISALTYKLSDALSARASFQFNSESNPPLGRKNTDTTSRLTIVYGF